MTHFIRVLVLSMAVVGVSGCDRIAQPAAEASQSVSASSARTVPTRIEDARHPDSLKWEAEQIAAHPGRARRDNLVLSILRDGVTIARFEDRFDDNCVEACGAYTYSGIYELVDPATGKLTAYDHVSVMYSEDSFEYLVDSNGQLYIVGFDEALVSPAKTYLATADHNMNGDGSITLLDWKAKANVKFAEAKNPERPIGCSLQKWDDASRLMALCSLYGNTISQVEIVRLADGRWRMRELKQYDISALTYDDFDRATLNPGAKGVVPAQPVEIYRSALPVNLNQMHGYSRP